MAPVVENIPLFNFGYSTYVIDWLPFNFNGSQLQNWYLNVIFSKDVYFDLHNLGT
jgi:hypothetical protein